MMVLLRFHNNYALFSMVVVVLSSSLLAVHDAFLIPAPQVQQRAFSSTTITTTCRPLFVSRFPTTSTITTTTKLSSTTSSSSIEPVPPTRTDQVVILSDAKAVGTHVRHLVRTAAEEAIAARGHFALAIPGGSILKMLVGDDILSGGDDGCCWTHQTTLAYVNHKCVAMDDMDLATHAKAKKLFLDQWKGVNAIVLEGTDNGPREAANYEAKLKALPDNFLPRDEQTGLLPVFDLALIGVGDDGHVGSLYPGRDEVLAGQQADGGDVPWVLPVEMKQPPSITLSLPVMAAARQVVVAACGVSDKYPQGKSAGMRRAVADPTETIQTFPAVGLRHVATWIMDEAASSKLGEEYTK